ncbi:hypothetical protein AB8U03_00260 [Clostridium sp. Mt-5]|uniref:Uncharacterized protein n=1 Tax=Clostridium moutaii TaxID=3240932 RepID=A0ABV4BIM6_9CLOT
MIFENMVALLIAAEKECPQEVAFKYLDRYLEDGPDFKQVPKFRWTPQDIEDVMRLRQEGISDEEIGSYYGVKADTIVHIFYRGIARSMGIKHKKRAPKSEIQEMLKLKEQGWKSRELAEKFNTNIHTVYSRIYKAKKRVGA